MNWTVVIAICEVIGAIAIVATLVYLSVQIRQNARALERQEEIARSQIWQARADSITNLSILACSTPKNIDVITKFKNIKDLNPKELSAEEQALAYLLLTSVRANMENTYLQYKKGYLPDNFYRDVAEPHNREWGPLFITFDLPLTREYKKELERLIKAEEGAES